MISETLKDIVVIYHAHCQDGFGAAYAAWKKFGDQASYIPCSDRVVPPDGLVDKELYILDISYPKEVLLELERLNKRVVIIDHHISAEAAVKSLKENIFSLEHAASHLSWEYFVGGEVPLFIKMLEVIDLAKDKEDTEADVITYILSKKYTFENYEELLHEFSNEGGLKKIKNLGKVQHEYLELIIEAMIDHPDFVEFEGYTVPCINMYLPINEKSIALKHLYNKYPPFAMSYRFDDGHVKVSLRGNGEVDLTALAGKYGGGGHRGSSGFVLPIDYPLPFAKVVKKEEGKE